jgi:hypothetical protein
MANKIPVKTITVSLLFYGIVLILCACMSPVDIQGFMEDEKVQVIIEATKVAVKVDDKTGDGLVGRDRRIEGLKNNKYYMVEKEVDEDDVLVTPTDYPVFVTDYTTPGGLIDDLGYITRISGGRINGLTNFHTYTVRAATPLTGNIPYSDTGGNSASITITNGIITVTALKGTGSLDLSSVLSGTYDVMAVSVNNPSNSPGTWNWTSKPLSSFTSFPLEGADTTVDYVFVKNDFSEFKVLTVVMPKKITIAAIVGVTAPVTGATPVTTITQNAQYTGIVTWDNGNPSTFAPSIAYTATITLTAKAGYTLEGVTLTTFFTVAGTSSPATYTVSTGEVEAIFPNTLVPSIPTGTVSITITFDIADPLNGTLVTGTKTINVNGTVSGTALDETNQISLTVGTPIGGGTWSSITWEISTIANLSSAISGGGNTLTIKNGDIFTGVIIPGTFNVVVTAYLTGAPGVPYTANIPITVVP